MERNREGRRDSLLRNERSGKEIRKKTDTYADVDARGDTALGFSGNGRQQSKSSIIINKL